MKDKENPKKNEENFENSLSSDYIPKSKLGNLPINNELAIPEHIKKEMEKTKKDIDKFKEELTKKFSYIEAIGIVPVQASIKIEEEYEIPEEEGKRKLIHLLVIIPEEKFKEIGKLRTEAIQIAKKLNDKIWVHTLTPVDIWNLCLDSKFEIVEAFAMSFPILDKGILGALSVAQIHKTLVLKKFEKYVTSYVIGGSLVRGTTVKTSDVDVFIVIDDTDVKRMPRLELKEKLRSIILQYIGEAEALSGVKNMLNVQVYLMTEFWEAVKDASPVIFTFIRDGLPLYDRGVFLPWKSLLKMGKIKPSQEAIDMFMSSGDRMSEMVKRRILDLVVIDIYWGVITPSQALLMLYGQPPGNVYDTVAQIEEIFVKKEKILEQKYADILKEIAIKYYKGYEQGKVKEVKGEEVDRLLENAEGYMKRLKDLREQIEKRVQEKQIQKIYEDLFGMLSALTKKREEKDIIEEFESEFIKKGKFPNRFLEGIIYVSRVKKEMEKQEKQEKKSKKKVKEMIDNAEEVNKVDKARKLAEEIIHVLIEHQQRCELMAANKAHFIIKTADKKAELFFLQDVFLVKEGRLYKLKSGNLEETKPEELEKQLKESKNKEMKIDYSKLTELKKIFGEFELIG